MDWWYFCSSLRTQHIGRVTGRRPSMPHLKVKEHGQLEPFSGAVMGKCRYKSEKVNKAELQPQTRRRALESVKQWHWKVKLSDPTEKMPVRKSEMWSWEILLAKFKKSDSAICLQKSGQTGGRELQGPSDLVCKWFSFHIGKTGAPYITDSNSVELFNIEFFLGEKQTSKVKIPLFKGFVLPSDFQSQAGTLSRARWLDKSETCFNFFSCFWTFG